MENRELASCGGTKQLATIGDVLHFTTVVATRLYRGPGCSWGGEPGDYVIVLKAVKLVQFPPGQMFVQASFKETSLPTLTQGFLLNDTIFCFISHLVFDGRLSTGWRKGDDVKDNIVILIVGQCLHGFLFVPTQAEWLFYDCFFFCLFLHVAK